MWQTSRAWLGFVVSGAIIALGGAALIARESLESRRVQFETDSRIIHRLLSQQAVQHDAILETLTLLQPREAGAGAVRPEERLPAIYPQILAVERRERGQTQWSDANLNQAEDASRRDRRAVLVPSADGNVEKYRLLLAGDPSSYALTIAVRTMVPWSDWPMKPEASPVHVSLFLGGLSIRLQDGDAVGPASNMGWRFEFRKPLASASQPFEVATALRIGWSQLPWLAILLWTLAVASALVLLAQGLRQRSERRRAEALFRLGQIARLNTMGELAAGIAHELNQPLTAVLANTQAAQRLLDDDPPDLATAREAMGHAAAQSQRAAEVVGRLRTAIKRPQSTLGSPESAIRVDLVNAARRALHLLEPECQRRSVTPLLHANAAVVVRGDAVAIDQIIHNVVMNALDALALVEPSRRALELTVSEEARSGVLAIADHGTGIPAKVLPHIFEPFFSTREGGLGLGLSLCETLAQAMGGRLTANNREQGGAEFLLRLPLDSAEAV
jgi:signal transduction histidine kinase